MQIKSTNDIDNFKIFCLIVGSSGVGKTTLAATLEKDKTIVISAESGLLSIKDTGIDYIEIKSYPEEEVQKDESKQGFNQFTQALSLSINANKYENIFIDSLTELGQMIFNDAKILYPDKNKTFLMYEYYSDQITKILKRMRDQNKYNIFLTALDTMAKKDFTEVVSIDLIQKSLAKRLPALFDEVFYYQKFHREDGTTVRAICTDSDDVDFTKDRSGRLDKYEKPDLQVIKDKILKAR